MSRLLLLSIIQLGVAVVNAETVDKKRTQINFEDQLVEGELRKPELFYLLQRKQIDFGRMIKMRDNFLPEMRRYSDDLRSGGNP
ncbi:MAG: hypothetical protein COT74_06680 [Bdellovibrionales bacterium CG10_big_fil_rev_8_21_14_0_10_45_34]|nr:MAG: hypothetical protein COT74_06680 [Bdellovibrionales bacterium CG10_big_fil_rev_8_21_14_0_10_45_34]